MGRIQPTTASTRVPTLFMAMPSHRSSPKSTADRLVLSRLARGLVRVLLLGIVSFNAALLTIFARLYRQRDTPKSLMWLVRVFYLSDEGNKFVDQGASRIAAGYAVLAAVFLLYAVTLLTWPFSFSRLRGCWRRFRSCFRGKPSSDNVESGTTTTTESLSSKSWARLSRFQYLIGVTGPYFGHRQLADDLLEVVSQTAAAYTSSDSISNASLHVAYGGVIFLTCASPALLTRVYPHSIIKQRIASLLVDLVLDFVWGSLLPIAMYIPIIQTWRSRATFSDDVSNFAPRTREIERIVILSWSAYALSLIPFLTTIANIHELQSILHEHQHLQGVLDGVSALPTPSPSSPATEVAALQLTDPLVHSRYAWIARWLRRLLPVYGLAALANSLVATRVFHFHSQPPTASKFECVGPVYPWFTMEEACSGRRVNCSAAGITGTADEIGQALDSFYVNALGDLSISDCPALEIPREIQRFNNLQSLAIKNSQMVHWRDDAALIGTHFHRLRTISLYEVVFTEMPSGLVAHPLTSTVEWMHLVSIPNATQLLDSVGTNWERLRTFDCVKCGLTVFPPAIKTFHQLSKLKLFENDLPSIPSDWLSVESSLRLDAIYLDGNKRLTTLPDSVWRHSASCELLTIIGTQIASIPSWVAEIAKPTFTLLAAFTPVCSQLDQLPAQIQSFVVCELPH